MHELIQCLLLEEFDQFRDRFQSFLDQIPRPTGVGAAPSRRGFFQGFFLGMFSSARDINVSIAYNAQRVPVGLGLVIDSIYFKISHNRERYYDELHIAVRYAHNRQDRLSRFVFLNNGCREGLELAEQQQQIRNQINNLRRLSCVISIDLFNGMFDILQPLEVGVHENRWGPLAVQGHHRLEDNNRLDLGQTVLNMSQGDRQAIDNFLGYAVNLYNQSLGQYNRSLNQYNQSSIEPLQDNLFEGEAFQHGFLTGILMNFRYRLNLKSYVEIISGRGYADIILLVRGEGRSFVSDPMIIELKRTQVGVNSSHMALQEAEWYARALRRNKIRVLQIQNTLTALG